MQNARVLAHRVSSRGTETTDIKLLTSVSADAGHRASLSMRLIPALLLLSLTGAQVKPQRKVAVCFRECAAWLGLLATRKQGGRKRRLGLRA